MCVCLYSNSKHRHPPLGSSYVSVASWSFFVDVFVVNRSARVRDSDQIRSSLAAPLTLAEVSSLGHQSQDAQILRSGALLGAGPGAWNSGPTVLDSLNDRVGLARGSWRETQSDAMLCPPRSHSLQPVARKSTSPRVCVKPTNEPVGLQV